MKRIEDFPHVEESIVKARRALGLAQSRKNQYWSEMDPNRRAIYLQRAGVDFKPWPQYSVHEKFKIETVIKRIIENVRSDAEMMGALKGGVFG